MGVGNGEKGSNPVCEATRELGRPGAEDSQLWMLLKVKGWVTYPSSKVLIKLLGAYVRGNFLRRKRNRVNQTNATKRIGTSVETTLDAEFAELELWAEPMFGSLLWFCRFQNVSLIVVHRGDYCKTTVGRKHLKLYLACSRVNMDSRDQ